MKIVYLIDSLHQSGGTERVLTIKANWLAENGNDVTFVLRNEVGTPFFLLSDKISMRSLHLNNKSEYRKILPRVLNEIKPDVTISVGGCETGWLYKLNDGSKKILEFHYTKNFLVNFVRGIRKLRLKKLHLLKVWLMQKNLVRHSRHYDKLVGLTKRDVGLWGNPANMIYIYNPLSFRSKRKSDCKAKRIIAVGSLTPAKGMDQLIEAFGMIAHKYPDWHLDIYGSGQDHGLLLELIQRYDIASQVEIHEPIPNIVDKLVESSIYAFPSRSDGFGLVITEAMECGLPTVAMDCECGPREILTRETGILVSDKDIIKFSCALEKLMTDDNLRVEMGQKAQQEVKRFYADAIMPQWVTLFNQLLTT